MKGPTVLFLLACALGLSGCVAGNTSARNDFSDPAFDPLRGPRRHPVIDLDPGERTKGEKQAEASDQMWDELQRGDLQTARRRRAEREKFEAQLTDALARDKAR